MPSLWFQVKSYGILQALLQSCQQQLTAKSSGVKLEAQGQPGRRRSHKGCAGEIVSLTVHFLRCVQPRRCTKTDHLSE